MIGRELKQLVAEKHRYFNDLKVTQSAESFVSFKKYRKVSLKLMKMVKKRKTKNQYATLLTVFSGMGIYRGQIVPLNVEK